MHKGDETDPRVAVIEVIPDEIKYWISEQSAISRTIQVATSAVMGKATAPGKLRTIHKEEVGVTRAIFLQYRMTVSRSSWHKGLPKTEGAFVSSSA